MLGQVRATQVNSLQPSGMDVSFSAFCMSTDDLQMWSIAGECKWHSSCTVADGSMAVQHAHLLQTF